jgi:hypothetical protein
MASTLGLVGCQSSGSHPFPDAPLLQAKKPRVGSQPHPATDALVLAEPDMPCCSPDALAQLPAPPEPIPMVKEPTQIVAMPHPSWLDAVPPATVAVQPIHEPSKTGLLVSRSKTLTGTERLEGVLVRDQAGHCFLLSHRQDAAVVAWDRVQLLNHGQLHDIASGIKVRVTGTWDEGSSSRRPCAFRVQHVETLRPGEAR